MTYKHNYTMLALSVVASTLLAGCGGGGDATTTPSAPSQETSNGGNTTPPSTVTQQIPTGNHTPGAKRENLNGSIIKGPIDGATIILKDASGKTIAQTTSAQGNFTLSKLTLTDPYYTIESHGGSYQDEATKQEVNLDETQGLTTLLTKSELEAIVKNQNTIAITPETTLYEMLLLDALKKGKALKDAIQQAKEYITKALITGTSPMAMLPGDTLLKEGNLTTPIPKDQREAFARNRAISFSYMARDLGMEPDEVFGLIEKIGKNLQDGTWDNEDLNGDGEEDNATEAFALARTTLFQETTTKLQNGELSEGQKKELQLMGFDVKGAEGDLKEAKTALQQEIAKYSASDRLPLLRRLPTLSDEDGNLTDDKATYTLTAQQNVNVTIETPQGAWMTPMWRYNNQPLPVLIRTKRGDAMTLNFHNALDANSTIHWHGFQIPAVMDGGPDMPVKPNEAKTYSFTMNQPAAPLWFHPHPDMQTGKQVYMGLAGVFLLEDEISKTLEASHKLPSGEKDVVLLVQDRRFDGNTTDAVRKLKYMDQEMDMDGMLGDTILVNGSVVPKLDVNTTQYRFRLYNVSNARTYDFALSDGSDFTVVATDGGLLEKPVTLNHITLGAAERVEIVIDFAKYSVGEKVMLVSQPFGGDMMGMMGSGSGMGNGTPPMNNRQSKKPNGSGMNGNGSGMGGNGQNMNANNQGNGNTNMSDNNQTMNGNGSGMGGNGSGMGNGMSGGNGQGMGNGMNGNMGTMQGMDTQGMLPNGAGVVVMRFDVTQSQTDDVTLYDTLPATAAITHRMAKSDADNANHPRAFVMSMGGMGNMSNGGTMGQNSNGMGGMNQGGGMNGMSFVINGKSFDPDRVDEYIASGAKEVWSITNRSPMAHPFHAHAIQYQILERNGKPATGVDLGWKDTFLVQPGETIKIIGDFSSASGDYMYHCHILEHEDAGMMGYFRVGESGQLDNR